MEQKIRFMIAVGLLASILFLARNQVAWANGMPTQESVSLQNKQQDSGQQSDVVNYIDPGSVKPPPIIWPGPPILIPVTGEIYPVGGVCTLELTNMAADVKLEAELLSFDVLGNRPKEFKGYLAGVCSLIYYHKSGEHITNLAASDGNVKICFAAVPNTTSQIYVYDDVTWLALQTSQEDGLMCAIASKTGKYVLSELP